MANIGRAILAGLSAGMKSQADQIGADINLDNQVRLLAVQDMIHQRAAEQGHSWDIENREDEQGYRSEESQKGRDFSAQQAQDERDWGLKMKTSPEIATQIANAETIGMRSKANAERDITKELDKDADYKQAATNMAKIKEPFTERRLDLQEQELGLKAQHERTLEAKAFGVDSNGSPVGGNASHYKVVDDQLKIIERSNDNLDKLLKYETDPQLREMYKSTLASNGKQIAALSSLLNGGGSQQSIPGANFSAPSKKGEKDYVKASRQYQPFIDEAIAKTGLEEHIFKGLIEQESTWDPNARPKVDKKTGERPSSAGGLAQLLDGTAKELGVTNKFDPRQSILGGADYLKKMKVMYRQYDDPRFYLQAYNAGPGFLNSAIASARENGLDARDFDNVKKFLNKASDRNFADSILAKSKKYQSAGNDTAASQPEQQETAATQPQEQPSTAQPQAEQAAKKRLFALNGEDNNRLNEAINNGQFGEGKVAEDKYNLFNTMYKYTGNYQKSMMAAMGGEVAKNKDGQEMPGHYRLRTGELIVDPEIQAAMDKAASMNSKVNRNPVNESPTPRKGLLADIPKKGDTISTKDRLSNLGNGVFEQKDSWGNKRFIQKEQAIPETKEERAIEMQNFLGSLSKKQQQMFNNLDEQRKKSILDVKDNRKRAEILDKFIEFQG